MGTLPNIIIDKEYPKVVAAYGLLRKLGIIPDPSHTTDMLLQQWVADRQVKQRLSAYIEQEE